MIFDLNAIAVGEVRGGYVKVACEQVPNWNSRVFLSDKTDCFGIRRAMLDWRMTDIDRRTIKHMVIGFGRATRDHACRVDGKSM